MKFKDLHWTDSNIEAISVNDRTLTVIASGVICVRSMEARNVRVTFLDVAEAKRAVTEYIGEPKSPKGFKNPYIIEEFEKRDSSNSKIFSIEGISTFQPIAWLDLEIQAREAIVEKF